MGIKCADMFGRRGVVAEVGVGQPPLRRCDVCSDGIVVGVCGLYGGLLLGRLF